MTEGPFWSYYGGKWKVAIHYPPPVHDTVVEPFAGAAGYSCRYPDRRVHLYDMDEHVVGTWEYLIRTKPSELRRLPDIPEGGTVDDLPAWMPQEARWLVGWWANAGSTAPKKRKTKWARRSGGWSAVRDRVAKDAALIEHWTIERRPWWEIEIRGDTTWFIDPPYQHRGRYYRYSDVSARVQRGGWAGGHTATTDEYLRLGVWCRELPSQAIVCEQAGADWLPFEPFRHVPGQSTRRNHEVIWTNTQPGETT